MAGRGGQAQPFSVEDVRERAQRAAMPLSETLWREAQGGLGRTDDEGAGKAAEGPARSREGRSDTRQPEATGSPDLDEGVLARAVCAPGFRSAAVLIGLVDRPGGAHVLLTRRTEHLREHAGQIAFPGGRVETGDADAVATARREAGEEIGLGARFVEPLGLLDCYRTSTGFDITPVLAVVTPGFVLTPDPAEVAEIFEVPLSFLMNPGNYRREAIFWRGRMRRFYAIPYETYYIWGATAGILKSLYERLYAP